MTERLLDRRELAALFAVKRATLARHARAGALPSVLLGKRRRYRRGEVEDVLGVGLQEPLLRADDVADLLRVSRAAVREFAPRSRDPLPSVRVGGSVRFDRSAVGAWIDRQRA